MNEIRIPQSVINEVEMKRWNYERRAEKAIRGAAKRYAHRLYLDRGYDFTMKDFIVVESK